ncbi:MAG: phospho-sugar mutase, partial [Actinomycetota bacterium]|nr:phospho-sugar mutase [Actinomycetota bacterium]
VVRRAAAGLAAWLREQEGLPREVVVGYDARHGSRDFAEDTARVLGGAGLRPLLLPGPLPTPVLAFAVRYEDCAAGVMVTASHNPATDNGYKVYLADGAQLVPPADAEIEARIRAVGRVTDLPLADEWEVLDDGVVEEYLEALLSLSLVSEWDVRIAYTPLHGVGLDTALAAFRRGGFEAVEVVRAQAEPDPDFPTAPFPNPEEPGALDLLLALAERTGADVAIANDPDADRCAVAVPLPDGGWRPLSGDEVGWLLADHVLAHTSGSDRLVATTIVSSSMLGRIAESYGVAWAETLTGFKWIARAQGGRLVFGYEEALGYAVGPTGLVVRDKDGIGAALVMAEVAARAKAEGRTLLDRLDDLARRHGVHLTSQVSVRREGPTGPQEISRSVEGLLARPPAEVGGLAVERVVDLADPAATGLPATPGVRLHLERGARVVVRPSGTEPKVKAYLEVVAPVRGGDLAGTRAGAARRMQALQEGVRALVGPPS